MTRRATLHPTVPRAGTAAHNTNRFQEGST